MEIKIKILTEGCTPEISEKGDWIDLKTAEEIAFVGPEAATLKRVTVNGKETKTREVTLQHTLIPLGIAVRLPEGFEAILAPRSSTFLKHKLMQTNSIGIIDNSYCGNNDEWKMPVMAFDAVTVPKFTRLCQFRIQPSMNASVWTKLKWLFNKKIVFNFVDDLGMEDRGGFGTTGL